MRRLNEYAANGTHNSQQLSLCVHSARWEQKPIRYTTIDFQDLAQRTGVTETSL